MNVINIVDKSKADELSAKGFSYMQQEVCGKKFYSFVGTPELINLLNTNFSKQDFFMSKYINFKGKGD